MCMRVPTSNSLTPRSRGEDERLCRLRPSELVLALDDDLVPGTGHQIPEHVGLDVILVEPPPPVDPGGPSGGRQGIAAAVVVPAASEVEVVPEQALDPEEDVVPSAVHVVNVVVGGPVLLE